MWDEIANAISTATGAPFEVLSRAEVGGGCINEAVRLDGPDRSLFVKLNSADRLDMFQAEAAGLGAIAASETLRVPQVVALGEAAGRSWLALEFIEFGPGGGGSSAALGEGLARMHRHRADRYGWDRENTIGATPQRNPWSGDWPGFFADSRIGFQLDLAHRNGAGNRLRDRGQQLVQALPALFASYRPPPSLLHGDLWGGNWGADSAGSPVLFDPAVYFGDREADLAMTELFGGFDRQFYDAYQSAWPLDPGYPTRRQLYNLYHILNHFNLFGGAYASQAQGMIDKLLAELGQA